MTKIKKTYTVWYVALALGLLAGMLWSPVAEAGEASLSWTPPTQNTDNSPYTDPAGTKIYYGQTEGGPYPTMVDVAVPNADAYVVTGLNEGETYHFVATAYNQQGTESVYSGQATKTIEFVTPNPPGGLTVVALTAYYVIQQPGVFAMIAIGTVPAGTPCDSAQYVNGYNAVDTTLVDYTGTVRPQVVVAQCG